MRFQFFAIPALFPEAAQTELNQFLARHRVAQMESRLVEAGAESYWTVSVRYFENSARANGPKANRIDYQEVLNPADFAVYNQLRAWRKKLAEQEGVPVYNILNNEQMAEVATRRPTLAACCAISPPSPRRLRPSALALDLRAWRYFSPRFDNAELSIAGRNKCGAPRRGPKSRPKAADEELSKLGLKIAHAMGGIIAQLAARAPTGLIF